MCGFNASRFMLEPGEFLRGEDDACTCFSALEVVEMSRTYQGWVKVCAKPDDAEK